MEAGGGSGEASFLALAPLTAPSTAGGSSSRQQHQRLPRRHPDGRHGAGGGRGGDRLRGAPPPSARSDPAHHRRRFSSSSAGAAHDSGGGAHPPPPPWRGGGAPGGGLSSLPARCALLRLHEEVLEFAGLMSPTPAEMAVADAALTRVREAAAAAFPAARLEVFGSRANGLVLPTSDWDVVLFGVAGTPRNMHRLAGEITARGLGAKLEVIDSARVPIVKLREAASGIAIDISFDASSGLLTRGLIAELLARYPPVRPLVLVVKYFLIQRGLNETYSGGVGSFLLVLMVTHVVQQAGRAADAAAAAAASAAGAGNAPATPAVGHNAMNLGALLLAFLELYGFNLNYVTTGISLRGCVGPSAASLAAGGASGSGSASSAPLAGGGGCYFSKSRRGWLDGNRPHLLSLESPVDSAVDAGKNSWAIQRVRRAFAHAHTMAARAVREWGAYQDALAAAACAGVEGGGASGGDASGGGRKRGRDGTALLASSGAGAAMAAARLPAKPGPSLLAAIVRPDGLLAVRAQELLAQRTGASDTVPAGPFERERGALSSSSSSRHGDSGSGSSSGSSGGGEGTSSAGDASSSDSGSDSGSSGSHCEGGAGSSSHHHKAGAHKSLHPVGPSHKRRRTSDEPSVLPTGHGGDSAALPSSVCAASSAASATPAPDPQQTGLSQHTTEAAEAAALAAARAVAVASLAASGLVLRKPGRLVDLFTRAERRVEERAAEAALSGRWY